MCWSSGKVWREIRREEEREIGEILRCVEVRERIGERIVGVI